MKQLSSVGCCVTVAGTAEDGLAAWNSLHAQSRTPEVVLLDHDLPDLISGHWRCREATQDSAGDPMLGVSIMMIVLPVPADDPPTPSEKSP